MRHDLALKKNSPQHSDFVCSAMSAGNLRDKAEPTESFATPCDSINLSEIAKKNAKG